MRQKALKVNLKKLVQPLRLNRNTINGQPALIGLGRVPLFKWLFVA